MDDDFGLIAGIVGGRTELPVRWLFYLMTFGADRLVFLCFFLHTRFTLESFAEFWSFHALGELPFTFLPFSNPNKVSRRLSARDYFIITTACA